MSFLFLRKEGLSKCGRCKQAFYCNVECQHPAARAGKLPCGLGCGWVPLCGCCPRTMGQLALGSHSLGLHAGAQKWKRQDENHVRRRQKEDWPMHKLECSPMVVFGENWNPSETVRLTARILAKQKTHPERTPSEKLLAVKEFESHLDKLDNEKKDLIQSDIAALRHFYSKHLEFPDNDNLVVLFAQRLLWVNGAASQQLAAEGNTLLQQHRGVEEHGVESSGMHTSPAAWDEQEFQPLPPTRFLTIDKFLLLSDFSVALMNHSCCPNVIVTYRGTLAEVRAVHEISPGEEVFTSYIDLLYPTEDRNDRLRDSYFFTCECHECTTKDKDKAKVEIRKLNDPPKAEAIRDMVRYARNVIEEFRRAKHYKYILYNSPPSELLEICELSQEKMSSVFEDSNVYMLHMMYQAMGVCLYMQDWEGALRYGQRIIKPYSKHYPLYSLNVASMWLKLGRLYMGLENKAAGERALKKAIAIMEVAHGKDHPYISEIKQEIESH
ncbi:N-lysine methyltransferase SMYD2 [Tupaia chinensis]|uniref:[histone H3]-lysine(4) N-trimethyltransferase n=1 Tax=Tupaia chinensis TaxID=246437 RepID=L9JXZ7_TUPCH|nr:N-lysine methyltransferase SMYD2 [Tupaia chinensis]